MNAPTQQLRITATDAAQEAIAAFHGAGRVMFVQSAGCCGGSVPMCYPLGELLVGPGDVLLGEVAGCPFYIDSRLDEAWGHPCLVLDVGEGDPEGFSLGAGPGRCFVTLGQACPP